MDNRLDLSPELAKQFVSGLSNEAAHLVLEELQKHFLKPPPDEISQLQQWRSRVRLTTGGRIREIADLPRLNFALVLAAQLARSEGGLRVREAFRAVWLVDQPNAGAACKEATRILASSDEELAATSSTVSQASELERLLDALGHSGPEPVEQRIEQAIGWHQRYLDAQAGMSSIWSALGIAGPGESGRTFSNVCDETVGTVREILRRLLVIARPLAYGDDHLTWRAALDLIQLRSDTRTQPSRDPDFAKLVREVFVSIGEGGEPEKLDDDAILSRIREAPAALMFLQGVKMLLATDGHDFVKRVRLLIERYSLVRGTELSVWESGNTICAYANGLHQICFSMRALELSPERIEAKLRARGWPMRPMPGIEE